MIETCLVEDSKSGRRANQPASRLGLRQIYIEVALGACRTECVGGGGVVLCITTTPGPGEKERSQTKGTQHMAAYCRHALPSYFCRRGWWPLAVLGKSWGIASAGGC